MKTLILADSFEEFHGGIERHALILQRELRASGHDARIIPYTGKHGIDLRGVDCIVVEGIHRRSLHRLTKLKEFAAVQKRVLFTHGSFFERFHAAELRQVGHKFGVTDTGKGLFDAVFLRGVLDSFSTVFTLSSSESAELQIQFPRLRTRVVPLQVFYEASNSLYHPSGRFDVYRPYICSVSRVHTRKNFSTLLDAIRGMRVEFVLAGSPSNDAQNLIRYARATGVSNFRYLGVISDAERAELIRESVAGVLPSHMEGTPLFAYEVLASGRPMILTSLSYMEDRPGLLKCTPTTNGLAAAIRDVMSRDVRVDATGIRSNERVCVDFLKLLQ